MAGRLRHRRDRSRPATEINQRENRMLKRRIRNLAVAAITIALAAGLSTLAATAAYASDSFPVHNHDGLCLGITGGEDDAPAVQWTCNGSANQTWHWGSSNAAGYTQLINGDGECLGVAGESTSEGARIYGWTCNGHPDQYWAVSPYDGYDIFHDYHSGLVLGVAGGSTAVGAAVVQWASTLALNQLWYT